MIPQVLGFIGGLLSNDKTQDTIIDIVRDSQGLDDHKKVDKLLEYINSTKHMSRTRRVLAVSFLLGLMVFTGTWLIAAVVEHAYVFWAIDTTSLANATASENLAKIKVAPLTRLRNEIYVMANDVLKDPMKLILGLYFGTQAILSLKK